MRVQVYEARLLRLRRHDPDLPQSPAALGGRVLGSENLTLPSRFCLGRCHFRDLLDETRHGGMHGPSVLERASVQQLWHRGRHYAVTLKRVLRGS